MSLSFCKRNSALITKVHTSQFGDGDGDGDGTDSLLIVCIGVHDTPQSGKTQSSASTGTSSSQRSPSPSGIQYVCRNASVVFTYSFIVCICICICVCVSEGSRYTLEKWNTVLSWLRLPGVITLEDVYENSSSLLTLVVESIMNRRLPNIIRSPLLVQHYVHNAEMALESLQSFIGKPIQHISAQLICEGDPATISRCADILYELYSAVMPYGKYHHYGGMVMVIMPGLYQF